MAYTEEELKKQLETKEYEYGFYTDIDSETFPVGLSEEIVVAISKKKNEPKWMTEWRLDAFKIWKGMKKPSWSNLKYKEPDYQGISYYSAPKKKPDLKSLDEVDPELIKTFNKLGISIDEQKRLSGVAMDVVVDSVSVATSFKDTLEEKGIIFCSISDAIKNHPKLVRKYIGTVIPKRDNYFAALNSAVDDAEIKYSTVQNWFPGDKDGNGGVFNFVTKRGICHDRSKISWTQVETGSAVTWKYPSCVLKGNDSIGEFYSIAVTNNFQQADTGTKMIHIGKNTKSTIISKGVSAGKSQNSYRGLVKISPMAENARNFSQCDSLLMGNECGAHTFPYIEAQNKSAQIEHEASTSKIGEDQIFYCNQRGIDTEKAIALIVNGFSKEVLNKLPMEFAVEAQKLLEISLEGSVG